MVDSRLLSVLQRSEYDPSLNYYHDRSNRHISVSSEKSNSSRISAMTRHRLDGAEDGLGCLMYFVKDHVEPYEMD